MAATVYSTLIKAQSSTLTPFSVIWLPKDGIRAMAIYSTSMAMAGPTFMNYSFLSQCAVPGNRDRNRSAGVALAMTRCYLPMQY